MRIERFQSRIAGRIIAQSVPFNAEYYWTERPIPLAQYPRDTLKPIQVGDQWGRAWESAWFRLRGSVPESWKGNKVVARLDFSGEGLVCTAEGGIVQGISNGSIFDADFSRDIVPMFESCSGGEAVELWVEAAANGLFGVFTEPDPSVDSPLRYGKYDAIVKAMELCVFDDDLWHLWLDLRIINGLIKTLPENSVRRARLIRTANEAIDIFLDDRRNANPCREILREELGKPASASELSVLAVGHAHIDTAWLWPVAETVRKCARTFASQLALLDKYPTYVFGASQPQHYAFVKDHYPELYAKIKQAVRDGHWELQGGMWVEADCNLISGESMIRQILHGKNFFKDEFDIEVRNLWLPDVFGYSAALPQILTKSGIDFFLTQKLSWNQVNDFPHHTFLWRGIDGSEVLAHFPPENTYNSSLGADSLVLGRDNFKEKDFLDEFASLFGVGDGGGGPKEDHIEFGLRMADLESAPKVRFGKASDFFERLKKHTPRLPTWAGELYLELHRGTLTTQAAVKKSNRQLEHHLRALEILWSCLPLEKYPAEQLDTIWKKVLLNQFHDILPGSSITKVYETTRREYQEISMRCDSLIQEAATQLFEKDEESLVAVNGLSYPFDGPVVLPENWDKCAVIDADGNDLPVQCENQRFVVHLQIDPFSFITLKKNTRDIPVIPAVSGLILENELVRYEFAKDGSLVRAWDKECGREILSAGKLCNILTLYEDYPNDWDAWDIDVFYQRTRLASASPLKWEALPGGPVRQGLFFELTIGNSNISQHVYLGHRSRRLDFETTVDWREKHRMLRVAFPVNVHADRASFDIQYGYVKRSTHRNTSWDTAAFETVGHRYADLSESDYGVALLNDCKYGYRVHENVIDLNLLRSPTYPDPDADQGQHQFTYSLLPHPGDLIHSDVLAHAEQLNQGLLILDGYTSMRRRMPWRVEGEGLSLAAVKRAEKENCLILRIVETRGSRSHGRLIIDKPNAVLIETDLMEWAEHNKIPCDQPLELQLQPFEIKTYKLRE